MKDEDKTKEQLSNELMPLRRRIAELEKAESERKRAEKALRNNQERLNLALKSSKAGTWDRDITTDKATWDEHLHVLFGLIPGKFSGKLEDFLGMLHPDDRERVRDEMTAAMDGNADYATTYRVVWPDSSVHVLADRGKVYRDNEGWPVRMLGVNLDVTELKQTEEALKESQQQLADIINFLPDATFVIDREGKVISWNRAIEEMTGIKAEEILGKGNYEYALPFHGARRPILIDLVLQPHEEVEARYDNIERKESMLAGEAYMPALKGGALYLFGTASILRDSKGNIVGAIESIRDISERKQAEEELGSYRDHLEELVRERTAELTRTNERLTHEIEERKKAEQALQESQRMLQLVLDTIPIRVFWKNLDSNFLGCNRPFALDAGLQSPEDILGRNDFEMGWAEQAELYRSDDRLVMETGSPKLGYEEPQTMPDGGRIWLRTNKVPLLDTEGRIKGVLGTYEDITERKRAENIMQARLRLLEFANSHSMDELLTATLDEIEALTGSTIGFYHFLESDQRTLSLQNWSTNTLKTMCTAVGKGSHYEIAQAGVWVDCVYERHPVIHNDYASLPHRKGIPEGHATIVRELVVPIFRGNLIKAIIGVGNKSTDYNDSDIEMASQLGDLSWDITDRKRAEEALRDASEKLKLFAYSVAHDLKSPAIGVYGLTKRLNKYAKEVLDEKGRNYCDKILKASEHIAALVDKVNIYIATKEARLSIERINIAEIIRMLKDEFGAQLNIRRIDWLEPGTTVEIRADRLSMLRAFRNFVDNSLKYGGERLSTIWTGYEESEDFHIFSFSDNGKGLKEEGSEKIFGAFQRNETSRGVEGAGLGLTIVKEIAEQHGGKVWVEPRTQKGTTFYISISKSL